MHDVKTQHSKHHSSKTNSDGGHICGAKKSKPCFISDDEKTITFGMQMDSNKQIRSQAPGTGGNARNCKSRYVIIGWHLEETRGNLVVHGHLESSSCEKGAPTSDAGFLRSLEMSFRSNYRINALRMVRVSVGGWDWVHLRQDRRLSLYTSLFREMKNYGNVKCKTCATFSKST